MSETALGVYIQLF